MNKTLLPAAAVVLALAACSSATSAPPPTAAPSNPPAQAPTVAPVQPTAVPPTQAPPPTATALPPTATRVPPTAAPALSGLDGIMNRMTALDTTYRFSMSMNMTGVPGVGNAEIMAAQGDGQGQNSRTLMNGMAFQLMGAGKGVEMMSVDKRAFIKGPMPLMGAPEAKWYELRDNRQVADNPVQNFFGRDGGAASGGFDPKSFKKSGSEKIDGVSCDIYEGDQEALKRAFDSAQASGGGGGATAATQIQEGAIKMWACEDGYVRRTTLDLKMAAGGQSVNMSMLMRMYDFGVKIDPIVAPADAQPIQAAGPGVRNTPRP